MHNGFSGIRVRELLRENNEKTPKKTTKEQTTQSAGAHTATQANSSYQHATNMASQISCTREMTVDDGIHDCRNMAVARARTHKINKQIEIQTTIINPKGKRKETYGKPKGFTCQWVLAPDMGDSKPCQIVTHRRITQQRNFPQGE